MDFRVVAWIQARRHPKYDSCPSMIRHRQWVRAVVESQPFHLPLPDDVIERLFLAQFERTCKTMARMGKALRPFVFEIMVMMVSLDEWERSDGFVWNHDSLLFPCQYAFEYHFFQIVLHAGDALQLIRYSCQETMFLAFSISFWAKIINLHG